MLKKSILKLVFFSFLIIFSLNKHGIARTYEAELGSAAPYAPESAYAPKENLITKSKAIMLINSINLGYQDNKWYHNTEESSYKSGKTYHKLNFSISIDFPDMQVILELSGILDKDFRKKTSKDVAKGHFNRFNPFNDDQHQSWAPYLIGIESYSIQNHRGNSEGLKMKFRQDIAKNNFHEVTGKFQILKVRYNFKDKEHKHINKDVSKFLFENPDLLNYIEFREEKQKDELEKRKKQELEKLNNANKNNYNEYFNDRRKDNRSSNYAYEHHDYSQNNNRCEGLKGHDLTNCENGQGGYGNSQNTYDPQEEDYDYNRFEDGRSNAWSKG